MWYYELNQQPFGPVSRETIADELKAGRITPQTRIWREGWAEWRRLGETELATLAGMTPPPATGTIPPTYTAIPQYKKVNLGSITKLFWWWFGLYLSVFPFIIITLLSQGQPWVVGLMCVFEIPFFVGMVLQYILVYKFWQVIQDGFARTTPGKAVGFLFIPFFNFYWWFVAFFGLSKDQNAYIDRHFGPTTMPPVRKAHPAIALGYIIFSFVYIVFYSVLMIIMGIRMINSFSDPASMISLLQPYGLVVSIFSYLQIALLFTMFIDFFLTTKSILKAEENNPH
jgi:hypothetical protein